MRAAIGSERRVTLITEDSREEGRVRKREIRGIESAKDA